MAYHVGQILFVILNKKMQVYPMMVVEEITKRTIKGEEINYVLQGGSDPATTILLNHVEGEIFESADEAKYVLTSRANVQIEKIVDAAISQAESWYSLDTKKNTLQKREIKTLAAAATESETIQVEMPDGTTANLKNFSLVS